MIHFETFYVLFLRRGQEIDRLEVLSRVIGLIYDAALAPSHWQATLREIALFVDAALVTLVIEDEAGNALRLLVLSEDAPDAWRSGYVETYMRLNPIRLYSHATACTGDIVLTSDFMDRNSFELTRFYIEFLQPAHLVDNAAAVVDRSDGLISVLAASRAAYQGPANDTTRERLMLLAPHVRRALAISRCLDMQPVEAELHADLIDMLVSGVFFLTLGGRVVHCNRAGASLSARVPDLRIVDRIFAGDRFHLGSALRRAAQERRDRHEVLDIVATDGTQLAGHLVKLPTSPPHARMPRHPATFVFFVRPVTPEQVSYGATLQQRYRLTPREMSVVVALVETGGVPEIAALLGLSKATVESHLKAIFIKMSVQRQADVVKLAAGCALH